MAPSCAQVVNSGTTTRSASPGCGYESPNEDNQPAFFSSPSPTASVRHCDVSSAARPAFASRPSYVAALPPTATRRAHAAHTSNQSSLNDMISKAEKMLPDGRVTLKQRLGCYHWTFFTMTMATGGIANVIHSLSYQADWLVGIGTFFCLLNIALFVMNCVCITARFFMHPGSFIKSFTDQVESLFIPAFIVSIGIILINICEYGVPKAGIWLLRTMEVMFWIYVGLSAAASAGLYLILWSTLIFPVHMMTPVWVFPAYSLLLTAPLAGALISSADAAGHTLSIDALAVALCATTTQGTGCLIAFMISAAFIYRLMTQKLPRDMQRPGVFMSIGPFGFTAAGIAQLGGLAHRIVPPGFLDSDIPADIIKITSVLVGLWLWGLAIWFFLVSVGSLWKYVRAGHKMPFQMTWWSFVFPNTALVTATEVMGSLFKSNGLQLFGSVMTIILVVVWIGVFLTMLHNLRTRRLLWPKDE